MAVADGGSAGKFPHYDIMFLNSCKKLCVATWVNLGSQNRESWVQAVSGDQFLKGK